MVSKWLFSIKKTCVWDAFYNPGHFVGSTDIPIIVWLTHIDAPKYFFCEFEFKWNDVFCPSLAKLKIRNNYQPNLFRMLKSTSVVLRFDCFEVCVSIYSKIKRFSGRILSIGWLLKPQLWYGKFLWHIIVPSVAWQLIQSIYVLMAL